MANGFDVLFYGSIVISFAKKNSKATYETLLLITLIH